MNIQSTLSPAIRPQAQVQARIAAPQEEQNAAASSDTFFSDRSSLEGPLSRAIYGAALYGLPAMAGATMGINGLVPGALVGAGIGAATHLESAKQAGIFAATGAIVGACSGYIGFLGAAHGLKLPAVLIAAALGAGTQALYSLNHQN